MCITICGIFHPHLYSTNASNFSDIINLRRIPNSCEEKTSLLIPAVLAFSLCTGAVVPVLAEETSQTADAADNEQETHTQSATDTSDSPYEKGTITDTDFQSEWLNLKFTPPETVVMNTEEELQSVMKQGQTTLEESSGVELGDDACQEPFMK